MGSALLSQENRKPDQNNAIRNKKENGNHEKHPENHCNRYRTDRRLVIVLGASMMGKTADFDIDENSFKYSATEYNAESAAFGGDFYTYIYEASDIIVDELNAINKGMETVVKAQDSINAAVTANAQATEALIGTVNQAGGMIVIAIGLAILASGVQGIGAAFAPVEEKKSVEVPVEAEVAVAE